MSDDKKLNLPAIRKGGLVKAPKKRVQPLDLAKKHAVSDALGGHQTVREDIARREQGLDLVLAGDLTGSMASYHTLLKEKFSSLCRELFPLIRNLRIGVVFYLDHGSGDPYTTRACPLTKNAQEVENFISATATGCGGDADEAVEDAFHDIVNLNWREIGNRSVVLFGDARAHEPEACPHQHSYFDLAQKMFNNKIVVNSVFCGKGYSDEQLQKLEDVAVGDFSKRAANFDHPNFFSWIANVTGGMIIGVERVDDLIEIIQAAASKDSGNLEKYEEALKLRAPAKLNLVNIAKRAHNRRIKFQRRNLPDSKS